MSLLLRSLFHFVLDQLQASHWSTFELKAVSLSVFSILVGRAHSITDDYDRFSTLRINLMRITWSTFKFTPLSSNLVISFAFFDSD